MFAIILDDLRKRFGDKVLLRPEDLVSVIGIGKGQQANLRSQKRFPIPTDKIGGRVVVTIYDLAKHLAGEGEEEVSAQMINEAPLKKEKESRKNKKARKGLLEKNWWLFRAGSFISLLDECLMKGAIKEAPPSTRNQFLETL